MASSARTSFVSSQYCAIISSSPSNPFDSGDAGSGSLTEAGASGEIVGRPADRGARPRAPPAPTRIAGGLRASFGVESLDHAGDEVAVAVQLGESRPEPGVEPVEHHPVLAPEPARRLGHSAPHVSHYGIELKKK